MSVVQVTAYGGNLRFTLRHRPGADSSPISLGEPIVELGVSLFLHVIIYLLPPELVVLTSVVHVFFLACFRGG